MKILTFSTLYPNAAAPSHGVFVENRLAAFKAETGANVRVIAPIPWFPSAAGVFGKYARFASAPGLETRRGVEVRHPRYAIPPKVGMNYAPAALARAFERSARALTAEGWDFDLIDAHYLYPDGVAAVEVARLLNKPVVITARGSDVTQFTTYPRQREMILKAVRDADAVIVVAAALKDNLVELGAPAEKITVLRNGVDLEMFKPLDRAAIRRRLELDGPVIASVGSLIDRKGHDIAIGALAEIAEATLLIAGEGEKAASLKALAESKGVANRVRFLGRVNHQGLAEIYNAADALILASSREGWPNVLLEAMACGTPAVASAAGGCPEVVRETAAGRIVAERSAPAFAAALRSVLSASDRRATRAYAEQHSWADTSKGVEKIFRNAIERANIRKSISYRPIEVAIREKPKLLFTIDTEEKFDWSGFDPTAHEVCPSREIDRLQQLCAQHGVKPLYFITYPLMRNPEVASYFRRLAETGAADLGLHLHQWNTPPITGFAGEYYSWQSNLPADAHREKLRALVAAFKAAFGFAPRAHRAGRYGVAPETYRELCEIGVEFDFSPSAGFDFSNRGGPDFSGVSNDPFTVACDRGAIKVTPVCGAWTLRGGRHFMTQSGAPGLNSRHRAFPRPLAAPGRLTCEQMRFKELTALTRRLERDGTPVLTFSLHSTTLSVGGNPYAPDAAAVDAALSLMDDYLTFFSDEFGGKFIDLAELAQLYSPAR